MKIIKNIGLRDLIDELLYDDQSPLNIAGRISKHEQQLPNISKDSIYRYIESVYGRNIEYHRQKRKTRHRRHRAKNKKLNDRVFIDKRPKSVNLRQKIGHGEADFIVSGKNGKGILLVVVERKTRNTFLEKIMKVNINNVHRALVKIKQRFPEMKTITTDNDLLFQRHQELAQLLGVKIYFCHPYHSWEKGTVENINKHIRQDIPKGSNISKYSKKFIQQLEVKLNRRILACLNYLTPAEALQLERKTKKRSRVS